MSNVAFGAMLLFASLLLACASTTTLTTIPPGARVYVDDQYQGVSPVEYTDRNTVLATNRVRFELDGYETTTAEFQRDDRINPAGMFTPWFLWLRDYKQEYRFELEPVSVRRQFAETYREAAASVALGDSKEKVLAALMPTQAGIDSRSQRAPESFVDADGVRVDIYYLRSNVQPGGRIDKNDYTPYVFNDDELVSIGWAALDGADAR